MCKSHQNPCLSNIHCSTKHQQNDESVQSVTSFMTYLGLGSIQNHSSCSTVGIMTSLMTSYSILSQRSEHRVNLEPIQSLYLLNCTDTCMVENPQPFSPLALRQNIGMKVVRTWVSDDVTHANLYEFEISYLKITVLQPRRFDRNCCRSNWPF